MLGPRVGGLFTIERTVSGRFTGGNGARLRLLIEYCRPVHRVPLIVNDTDVLDEPRHGLGFPCLRAYLSDGSGPLQLADHVGD